MSVRNFNNGVYMTKMNGLIVVITDSEYYEDSAHKFWLVTYIYHDGIFIKTLLTESNLKSFVRIGEL